MCHVYYRLNLIILVDNWTIDDWTYCFPLLPSTIPVPPVLLSIMDMLAWATPVMAPVLAVQCKVFCAKMSVRWEASIKPVPDMGDSQIYFSCQKIFTTGIWVFFLSENKSICDSYPGQLIGWSITSILLVPTCIHLIRVSLKLNFRGHIALWRIDFSTVFLSPLSCCWRGVSIKSLKMAVFIEKRWKSHFHLKPDYFTICDTQDL